MKFADCISEALSNTFARPFQAALVVVLSASLAFAAFLLPWATMSQAHELLERDLSEGRTILAVGSSGGNVSTKRCDLLRTVDGVTTAGAVVRTVELKSQGGRPIAAALVTPGMPALQWPELSTLAPGSVVAPSSENALPTGTSTDVLVDGMEHQIATGGAVSSAGRISSLRSVVMIPSSVEGMTSECYVEAVPGAESGVAAVAAAWFPTSEGARTVPLVSGKPAGASSQELLTSSPQLWIVIGAVGVVIFTVGTSVWSRRHDFAVYQQLGLSRAGSLVMSLVESTVMVFAPAAAGTLGAVVVAALGEVRRDALIFASSSSAMFLLGVTLVPMVATLICVSVGRSNAGKL